MIATWLNIILQFKPLLGQYLKAFRWSCLHNLYFSIMFLRKQNLFVTMRIHFFRLRFPGGGGGLENSSPILMILHTPHIIKVPYAWPFSCMICDILPSPISSKMWLPSVRWRHPKVYINSLHHSSIAGGLYTLYCFINPDYIMIGKINN